MSLIMIIGLCGSGKSYYAKQLENYIIYDDFITTFYNGNLLYDLQNGKNVCAIDPRLCRKQLFDKYITIFEKYCNNISLVLFENDPVTCLDNSNKRNDGRRGIAETNNCLTLHYNLDNYKGYNSIVIPCFKQH